MEECRDLCLKLKRLLGAFDEDFGGDVNFFPPISKEQIEQFEKTIDWDFPDIFKYFYTCETNGLLANDKRILGFYSKDHKKTWVENLERYNDPEKSPWFKGRPEIFKDYLIVATDRNRLFCLSKKYKIQNPLLYITDDANSVSGVNFDRLNFDLYHLVDFMFQQAF